MAERRVSAPDGQVWTVRRRTVFWPVVGCRDSGEQRDRAAEWLGSTGTVPPDGTELT